MKHSARVLVPTGVLLVLLVMVAPAWAVGNYVGKTTVTGDAAAVSTVSNGLQCADNVNGPIAACTQAMTVSTGAGDASAHLGGTLQIRTALADAGTTCRNLSPARVCRLNDSASINYPVGNSGYDVTIINVGFSSHTANPTASQLCDPGPSSPNPYIKVARVSVAGGAGVLTGATGANGYSASFDALTHTATVAVPGSPWVPNTGTQEAGLCISDAYEDGIQVPFKIVAAMSASEAFGARNLSEATGQCSATSNPVNCEFGNFWRTFDDVRARGRGLPLDLSRTYNSLNARYFGMFGHGWSSTYATSLSIIPGGAVTVNQENGATVTFSPGSGGLVAPPRVIATLVKNADGTYTFTRRARQVFTFSSSGRLLSIADLDGDKLTLAYNASGQLETVTDVPGRQLVFAYGANGLVSSVTDPAGRTESYRYDTSGNLAAVTDVAGGVTAFTYDTSNRVLTMTDPRGGVVSNSYDPAGRVDLQTDAMNRKTTFAYAPGQTTITSPAGNITVERWNATGELASVTRGSGTASAATWSYQYDPDLWEVTRVSDPNGHVWTYQYQASGNQTQAKDPLGDTINRTFNSLNEPLTVTDENNHTTTYTYDGRGNLTSVSRTLTITGQPSQTQQTTLTYGDPAHPGDVTSLQDPNGHTSTFDYDAYGDLSRATDAAGDKTTYVYTCSGTPAQGCFSNVGLLYTQVSPRGNVAGGNPAAFTTTYTYNAFGKPLTITDPLGHQTTYGYDANDNRTSATDANNHQMTYVFDAEDELTQTNRPATTAIKTSWDADGNRHTQTDGAGNVTTYNYDPLDRLSQMIDPLNRATSYSYDGAGNLRTVVDGQLRTTTYGYDDADRLTSIGYSDGVTPNVAFTYYADGQRKTMADATGTSSYAYDSLERLTSATTGGGQTVGYGYDLANNQTSITYPNGKTVLRGYDSANRLASITDWLANQTTVGHDPDSNQTRTTFPAATGNVDNYAYDNADQLTSVAMLQGSTSLASLTYTRDNDGQVAGETQTGLPRAASTSYAYTAINQLQSADSTSYVYDPADNPTTLAGNSGYTYDAADQLRTGPSATFTYDTLGQRIASTQAGVGTNYTYDQAGRLTSATGPAPTTYTYDADNLRATKTSGITTARYTWSANGGLPQLLSDGSASYIYGPDGIALEQIDSAGTVSYIHHDQLGSTRLLTNLAGNTVAKFTYDPYGTLAASTGSAHTPLGYTGQYTDPETGLIYLRARYYDPSTAQFLTRDPLAALTRQPYGYASNNPLNTIDPSGLAPQCPTDAAGDDGTNDDDDEAVEAAKGASSGWRVGDDIWSATRAGNDPAWSTARGRYWKNVANDPAHAAQWDEANLARMRSGRAPQRFNPDKGGMESMELSHEPIPAREGGRGLVPRWPQDHAAVDPYRHPGY